MPRLSALSSRSLHSIGVRLGVVAVSGEAEFVTSGIYSWTAPVGVTSVSVVAVGGGGGGGTPGSPGYNAGGGGGLGWKNDIPVTPGQSYTVVVGFGGQPQGFYSPFTSVPPTTGGDSFFINTSTVKGGGAGASGSSILVFQNVGFNYSVDGFVDTTFPDLTLIRGQRYYFNLAGVTSGHPLALRLANGSTSTVPGATGNNTSLGAYGTIITYQVPLDAPSTIYYQCVFHASMIGTINIVTQEYTGTGGSYVGDGGGNGGNAATAFGFNQGSGPGAGGYSGNGANGTSWQGQYSNGFAGSGGGGGSGGLAGAGTNLTGGGGGVGIYGQGADGAAGVSGLYDPGRGGGGSGGTEGNQYGYGGVYGGGGGKASGYNTSTGPGGGGAVRIIWGPGRSFPTAAPIFVLGNAYAIFGYGGDGYDNRSITNLVSNTGVVATDTTGVGTARVGLAAAGYGVDKAIFGYGYGGSAFQSITNLVSNTGVVSTDTAGVGTARIGLAAAGYGADKAIFGYGAVAFGVAGQYRSMTNLVSNTGVVATDTTGVGQTRDDLAAARYGPDKAIFGFGGDNSTINWTNLVSNTGVVASDVTTASSTPRRQLAAAGYGDDKAIFGYGNTGTKNTPVVTSITNLVSNTGVVASNTAGVGTARYGVSAASYGTNKAIFGFGDPATGPFGTISITNLVSNTGVVATNTAGVGFARSSGAAASYG